MKDHEGKQREVSDPETVACRVGWQGIEARQRDCAFYFYDQAPSEFSE